MNDLFLPLLLAGLGFLAAFFAYRDIRRGGARFYTLEREAILRRASFTLLASVLLFVGSIAILLYERQQSIDIIAVEAGAEIEGVPTPTATLSTLPPTTTPTATPDPNLPTATPTPIVCRALVSGTGGSGLTLRADPGGQEVSILQEEEIVTLLEVEPVTLGNTTWVSVRTAVTREEGWVAREYLLVESAECQGRVGADAQP